MYQAIDLNSLVPVTRFNKGETGKILDELYLSGMKIIVKNNTPAAVMMSPKKYEAILEEIEDAKDYALALERERNGDNEKTYSNEEVMKELGVTQKEIDETEDVDLEYELEN